MKYTMLFKGSLYAIHQGVVPGYPASHGCVRVPAKDAQYLFSTIPLGSTVTIK
jgi:lipoprotein-anchoring transpeptidase ErfK/SrfK